MCERSGGKIPTPGQRRSPPEQWHHRSEASRFRGNARSPERSKFEIPDSGCESFARRRPNVCLRVIRKLGSDRHRPTGTVDRSTGTPDIRLGRGCERATDPMAPPTRPPHQASVRGSLANLPETVPAANFGEIRQGPSHRFVSPTNRPGWETSTDQANTPHERGLVRPVSRVRWRSPRAREEALRC